MSERDIDCVYVQSRDGVPSDEAFFKAWDGFRKLRVPCRLFDADELDSLPLTRQTLVAGAIRVVECALESLGVTLPPADNLPERLTAYRGRRIERSTWGRLRRQFESGALSEPVFVKPWRRNKGFPSIAVFSADDIEGHSRLSDDDEVLIAEYVVFLSEWRCFVCRGEVVDVSHYQGDPFCFPDPKTIRSALEDFGPDAPAGYGIDFGILENGRTVLVEVNEGYSLGSYGLNSIEYAQLLRERWLQLVA